jgi:ATP-binding cassette subfamily B multidrug efflux pump
VNLVRLARSFLAPYRPAVVAIVLLQLVNVVGMLYLPSLNADIIDKGVVVGDTGYIVRTGGWMLLISLASIVAAVAAVWHGARTGMGVGRDLRGALFRRVESFSTREVEHFGAPSLITRTTNDVQQVQMLVVMGLNMFVSAPIMLVGGVFMAMREDFGLSWIVAVLLPTLILALGFIASKMVPSFRLMQERIDQVNRVLREQITGIRVVRAFVREPYERARFARDNQELTDVSVRAGRWFAAMFPTVFTILNLSMVAVLWFGGHRVDDGTTQVGQLTAFLSYLAQILMSVMMATFMLMMVPRSAVCADRITEVLETESSVPEPDAAVSAGPTTGAPRGVLELDHVSFAYPGAELPVLRDVSLSATPGRTVAVIGSTGAGKSTLVNLVPRLFDATAGQVRLDGVDVRRLAPEVLWRTIGLVPQKAFLFSGTVGSNIRHGKPDATDEEVWEALRVAQADDFVERMGGLDAAIAQGGTNVSGGQRQRLAIARALVGRPSVYLFDDCFSALDVGTEARLRAALGPLAAEATVVVVAQRVSSIREADEIVVLEDGEVVGRGTHDDLLETCGTYQEIVESQASGEEAA